MDKGPDIAQIDACRYQLHFPAPYSTASQLNLLAADILTFVQSLASTYIWHKQAFNLALSPASFTSSAAEEGLHLTGKIDCTDCVDDEWFAVWLLKEISRAWPEVVIGVEDEDGEFLLIEAAEVLPKWVTPQNATNRVWIHKDRLHLVPIEHVSALPFPSTSTGDSPEEGFLDTLAAVELVRNAAVDTLAPLDLEAIVMARIERYPQKIEEHHHKTLTYLPVEIALALQQSPSLIAEAIAAFYEREPVSLRACNTMSRFPPSSPRDAFKIVPTPMSDDDHPTPLERLPKTVFVPIVLTRPLYSQLVLQRFFAPKVFEKVGWSDGEKGGEEERRRAVGMKIACGFEMLYKLTSPILRVTTEFDATDPSYINFIKRLQGKGFFGGEIPGSEKYRKNELIAREGWKLSRNNGSRASFAQRVDDAIAAALASDNPLPSMISSLPSPAAALALESSESWLTLDEQGFEELLKSRGPGEGGLEDLEGFSDDEDEEEGGAKTERTAEEQQAREVARKLEGMAEQVENFVQGRGALDGAEFDDEQSEDEDDSDEEAELSPADRAARMEALVAPLDPESWGQKSTPLASVPPTSKPLPPREPKLTEEKYDGASSDSSDEEIDASDVKESEAVGDEDIVMEEEDEDAPAVLDEEEVNMQEEMDEFLKFATETLGLTEEQYSAILGERRGRGAFVPPPAQPKKTNIVPTKETPAPKPAAESLPRPPLRNPNLTDFDALMEQMDSELAKTRTPAASTSSAAPQRATSSIPKPPTTAKPKPKGPKLNPRGKSTGVVESSSDESDDDAGEMDEELANLFKSAGGEEGGTMDYNLVKNFLTSFQSQGGFGGPAGNLSGRLGFQLPSESSEK